MNKVIGITRMHEQLRGKENRKIGLVNGYAGMCNVGTDQCARNYKMINEFMCKL